MIDLRHIRPVSDFNRNTKQAIRRLKKSGQPEVLTVNGEAQVIVQSAASYQKLLEDAELSRSLAVLRKSLSEAKQGKGRPARDVLRELAAKAGIEWDE
jgi:PHD/YefM family antitoxin component YafN of YafNO toxin-antitoxin module